MGGSKLKKHNVTLPRRQSLRLKGISAIYDIANSHSKHQQQISGGDCSTVASQSKIEVLEHEDFSCTSKSNECVNDPTDRSCPEKHIYEETITECDDQSLNDVTLKDLRASYKAKKQKVLKSISTADVGLKSSSHFDPSQKLKHEQVKPKEEELDLEELLITLKSKVSKDSTADGKRRKQTSLSPASMLPPEVVTAQPCSLSSNDTQGSMPVAQVKASITDRPSKDSAANLYDLKSEAEILDKDFGGSARENFTADNSLPSSICTGRVVDNFKTEIVEPCSLDGQNDIAGNSTLDIINTCNFFDNTSAELLQKVQGLNNNFPSSTPFSETILHAGSPELVCTIKSEILENDSPLHENTINVAAAAASNVDFIAKFIDSEKSSPEPFGRIEGVLETGGSNSTNDTSTYCCLNEVYTECLEPDQYHLPEIGEEHDGEIGKVDISEMPNLELCPSSVSVHKAVPSDPCPSCPVSMTIDPGADIHVSIGNQYITLEDDTCRSKMNQIECSASSRSYRSMDSKIAEVCASVSGDEDSQSLTHDLHVQAMPICSHIQEVTNDHSLLCEEHDLDEIFITCTEGEGLNNSAHHTFATDKQANSNESTGIHMEEFSTMESDKRIHMEEFSTMESDKLYLPLPSYRCCGSDSNAPAETSTKTEQLSSKEEGHAEEATFYSVEISGVTGPEGLTGAPDFQSPKISPCSSTLCGLHCVDGLSKAAVEFSSFGVEESLHDTKDQPASAEISKVMDPKGQNMEKEYKNDQELLVDHPPKKLLSNRKAISPTSQEKLCQALSDVDLCDPSQLPMSRKRLWFETWTKMKISSSVSRHKEAEALLVPERISKKPKNHSNGSFLSVNNGILKLQGASCRSPCSCMKSSSFHQQTEKVIEFSQRQMHDIENIAMKLLKGLKSMKTIVEESLCSKSHSSLPSKFTADEIRAAAENASELEKTTRRWLSMMTKDCNRFCKIMRLAENKEATPSNGVSKKRKKITFADEAGGVLCQVKVFDI